MEARKVQVVVQSRQYPDMKIAFTCCSVKVPAPRPGQHTECKLGIPGLQEGCPRGRQARSWDTVPRGSLGQLAEQSLSSTLGSLSRADSLQPLSLLSPVEGLARASRSQPGHTRGGTEVAWLLLGADFISANFTISLLV